MNFLKKLRNIFRFQKKEESRDTTNSKNSIDKRFEEEKLIFEEKNILKEVDNSVLENKIRLKSAQFPLKSKVVILKNAIKKLDNVEIKALSYIVKSYSLIISKDKEFFFINLKNEESGIEMKIETRLENEEQFLLYEKEYLVGKDKEIEIINNGFNENVNYKISLIKYIKIKITAFLCLYYPEILKSKKYYIDKDGEKIISNVGEYLKSFLEQRNRKFSYDELQKYFELELDKRLFEKINYDENGNFYFEIKEKDYFISQYILNEVVDGDQGSYFKIDFNEFISLKELNELEFEELPYFKIYDGFDEGKKIRFYRNGKKDFVQTIFNIQKDDIMII